MNMLTTIARNIAKFYGARNIPLTGVVDQFAQMQNTGVVYVCFDPVSDIRPSRQRTLGERCQP